MAQSSHTFRIFVSSTFSDLKAERNALQEKAFPRLRDLATTHGCRFQAIDLRWGVSEEAALDQQTMKICLGEIERCQKTSPRPNFIVLLGDRYGWRPLPAEIPADEFEKIIPRVAKDEKVLLDEWYRRDDNALPPVYCLQARSGETVDYAPWEIVETRLRQIFLKAIEKLLLSPDETLKYTASATEQEIVAGALRVPHAQDHVFCFFREINGLPKEESSKDFRDSDAESYRMQAELKERLKKGLAGNVHEYTAQWQKTHPSLNHLEQLCEDVYNELSKVILTEVGLLETVEPLEREIAAHEDFGKERARVFIGRADILNAIEKYISGNDPHPLAFWGASGSGKSALMAKAVEQAQRNNKDIIYRFIGATPESSNGRSLLESLCRQISRRYGSDESIIPAEYKDLVQEFPKRLALAKPDKRLVIFLDALDQLSDADNARNLTWLPADLPPNVSLTVSTLPGECLHALESKLPVGNRLEVQPMSVEEGKNILTEWLSGGNRQLQKKQEEHLLDKFQQCGLPLYLKLAFDEARLWKSYEVLPELSDDIPGVLRDLFKRLSLESNHGGMLVSRSLGYLAAAKNGLSEDELLDVLSLDKEMLADFQRRSPKSPKVDRLPVVVWSRLYFDLEPYLTERSADGVLLLAFYHRQMNEFAAAHYLNPAFHQRLANYFGDQPLYVEQDDADLPNLRKLSELPYQQAHGDLMDELCTTLTQFKFLEAKVLALGLLSLIDDFNLIYISDFKMPAETQKNLALIRDALRLSTYLLLDDQSQLASQLIGRLISFEESEIKTLLVSTKEAKKDPWLLPLTLCFTAPGGPLVYTLAGHWSAVNAVAVTPDGRRAISGSEDYTLKVWDLERGTELATLHGTKSFIFAVAVTPDGHRAIVGSMGSLKVWNLERGTELTTLQTDEFAFIRAVAVTPDGNRAISGSDDKTLKVWDLKRGRKIATLRGHSRSVNAVAVTPDGRRAISVGNKYDETLNVWDLRFGWKIATLRGHTDSVEAVAVTPDGRHVISGSDDKTLKVWDLKRGNEIATLRGHTEAVKAVAVTPDGRRAISGSGDTTLKVWDLERDREIATLHGHTAFVNAVVVTPDGRRAISGSSDNSLKVWDLDSGLELAVPRGHTALVHAVVMTPDGHSAISVSDDQTLKVWDTERGIELATIQGHKDPVWPVPILAVAVTPDGRRAISGAWERTLRVWDLERGTELAALWGHENIVTAVAVTPDGRRIISGSADQTLKVWDLERETELTTLRGHTDYVNAVAVTPDGRRAVSGSGAEFLSVDQTLKVWDLERGTELATLVGHSEGVTAVVVTPDGRRAISGSYDQTIKVWDLERGTELATLKGHNDHVHAVAVTPDGRCAVSAGHFTLRVWDLTNFELLATFRGESEITACAVAANGSKIFVGEGSGRVYFVRLENVIYKPSIVTAWLSKNQSIALGCPNCSSWPEISATYLGTELPCPNCGKPVKLNPFTIQGDWKPIAEAWQKRERIRNEIINCG
jgi:WD40 repeat protein